MNRLLTKILLGRFHHFGDGEEKLRADDGDYQAYRNKPYVLREIHRWLFFHREWVGICKPPYYSNDNYNQADYHGNVTQHLEEATGTVEFFKEIAHKIFGLMRCKDSDFGVNGSGNGMCFTA